MCGASSYSRRPGEAVRRGSCSAAVRCRRRVIVVVHLSVALVDIDQGQSGRVEGVEARAWHSPHFASTPGRTSPTIRSPTMRERTSYASDKNGTHAGAAGVFVGLEDAARLGEDGHGLAPAPEPRPAAVTSSFMHSSVHSSWAAPTLALVTDGENAPAPTGYAASLPVIEPLSSGGSADPPRTRHRTITGPRALPTRRARIPVHHPGLESGTSNAAPTPADLCYAGRIACDIDLAF